MRRISLAVSLVALAGCTQPPAPSTTPQPVRPAAAGGAPAGAPARPDSIRPTTGAPGGAPGGAAAEPSPRPYATVIRGDVKTKTGLFKTHRIGSRLYYEIPRSELGKDMLLVSQIAKTSEGSGYGGQALDNRVVRWDRKDHRILLKSVSYSIIADPSTSVAKAVDAANYNVILGAFNVETYGPDSAAVIEVTRLFTSPPTELGLLRRYRGTLDATRTFFERVATFPTNIETEATLTLNATPTPTASPFGGGAPTAAAGAPPQSKTYLVHWSMVKLPEQPMKPRLCDSRVGYFRTTSIDFSRPEQRSQARCFITRYRLEKKDPSAAVSEPVKPIIYWVDPATPEWLKPWVRKAIESWQPAFEAAGFKNGIIAKEAPSAAEDPDWSPEDARYSVIRWLPSTIENAVGPHVHDPRSGEIMEADLQIYHNVMNLNRDWYWTQVGSLDPRARKLPFPDSLQGRLMEYVIAHEIGHSLGFPHNMKASSLYPVDSVRSKTWVAKNGHTPTLMDYSRFNYVAQPEDGIALGDLIPKQGPYDVYMTHWGYAPIPSARTPDDERATLDAWAREQDKTPWLRFSTTDDFGADPGNNTEAVGDYDAVKSTALGIKNIKRLVPMVAPAVNEPLDDNDDLKELYGRLIRQWSTELRHVVAVVGAAETQEKYGSQPGPRFTPLSAARQREAVKFLNDNAFETPTFFLDQAILRRIEPEGSVARINQAQRGLITGLLNDDRMARLVEFEAMGKPGESYPLSEMLADMRTGIFSELSSGSVTIDVFRRTLQRSYVEAVKAKLSATPAPRISFGQTGQLTQLPARPTSDARALLRAELRTLDAQVKAASGKASNAVTRAHLADLHTEIDDILNPKK
ncbi:MAG: zinc-dependent metalloprotease [Gemmatimonadaceae bacterium]